tara:strand:+ start:1084 stop:1317 length:234 start_codon:yes stop_codon:yes gene_type:complete
MEQIEFYAREVSIMQQSQSKLALEFLTGHGITPTSTQLWRVTEIFVQCCLHKQNDVLKKRLSDLDKWVEKMKEKNNK